MSTGDVARSAELVMPESGDAEISLPGPISHANGSREYGAPTMNGVEGQPDDDSNKSCPGTQAPGDSESLGLGRTSEDPHNYNAPSNSSVSAQPAASAQDAPMREENCSASHVSKETSNALSSGKSVAERPQPGAGNVAEEDNYTRDDCSTAETPNQESLGLSGPSLVESAHDARKVTSASSVWLYGLAIVCLLISIVVTRFSLWTGRQECSVEDARDSFRTFEDHVAWMKTHAFPSQPEHTWRIIRSRGRQHLQKASPGQPAVFLVVAEEGSNGCKSNSCVHSCFAYHLAVSFTNSTNAHSAVQAAHFAAESNSDTSMNSVHASLDSALQLQQETGGRKSCRPPVLVVEELGHLPHPSPFLFFSLCDNSNAWFPDAVIILTLSIPSSMGLTKHQPGKQQERIVMDYLIHDLWAEDVHSEYRLESVEALVSRISDVLLVIDDEGHADGGICH